MNKTGEILKSARESKGVSLKEVSNTTRINLATLEAIEKGDQDRLPAKSFLRGFVGSYAKYLGLNVNDVLDCFSEEMGSTKPKAEIESEEGVGEEILDEAPNKPVDVRKAAPPANTEGASQVLHEAEQSHPAIKIAIVVGCLILLISIIFTKKVVDKYDQEAKVVTEFDSEPVTDDSDITSEDSSAPEIGAPEVNEETVETTAQKPVDEQKTVSTPEEPTSSDQSSAAPTEEAPKPTPAKPEVKPENKPDNKKVTGPIEVIIEALDAVKVDYRPDSGGLLSKSLEPEAVLTIRADSTLNIDFSDGGAVTVTYNGKDLGVPGNLGQPYKLRLP